MANLGLYSMDLTIWEKSEYLEGRKLSDVTYSEWERIIKGLYDWIRSLQTTEGKRRNPQFDGNVQKLMYAYGKRRPLKFVLVTVISKSHKKRLKQHLSDTVYHAHLLIYGYTVTVVKELIKYYWATFKKYSRSPKDIFCKKCYDNGKLTYNFAQTDGKKPKVCISPAINGSDLEAMYYGQYTDIRRFENTHRIKTEAILKAIKLYGNILISNGYSASVKGRWLAGIRHCKRA